MWVFLGRGQIWGHFFAYNQMYGTSWSYSGWMDIVLGLSGCCYHQQCCCHLSMFFNWWSLCCLLVSSQMYPRSLDFRTCLLPRAHNLPSPLRHLWECLLLPMEESWYMCPGLGTVHSSSVQSKESAPRGWPLLLLAHSSHQPLVSLPASSYVSVILKS